MTTEFSARLVRNTLRVPAVGDASFAARETTFAASEAALAEMRDGGRYEIGEPTDALTELAGGELAPYPGGVPA